MSIRLLILDDEKVLRSFLKCAFELEGYIVETASNGMKGLERAKGEHFDLIITDMFLPGVDGADLIARLRLEGKNMPIIGITGYSPQEVKLDAARFFGIDALLMKPFSLEEIRSAVIRALAAREKLDCLCQAAGPDRETRTQ